MAAGIVFFASALWDDNHFALIESPFGGWSFSPNGKYLAALSGGVLILASMDEGAPRIIKRRQGDVPPERLIGWTRNGSEILFVVGNQIEAWNCSSASSRPVCTLSKAGKFRKSEFLAPLESNRGIRLALLGNQLVDVEKRTMETLPVEWPGAASLSLDQEALVYAISPTFNKTIVHWRSGSGSDRIAASLDGESRFVHVAPDGQRAAVSCWNIKPNRGSEWQTTIVERDGLVWNVDPD